MSRRDSEAPPPPPDEDPPPPPPDDDDDNIPLPILPPPPPPICPLEDGDILITFDRHGRAGHAIIWARGAGSKVAVHSSHSGVTALSAGSFLKLGPDPIRVFRYIRNTILGAYAADAARAFARLRNVDEDGHGIVSTPYSNERLTQTIAEVRQFGLDSLFRAIRAAVRAERAAMEWALSGHKGVTCAQLVTYCYQAALIQHLHIQHVVPIPIELPPLMEPSWRRRVRLDPYTKARPFLLQLFSSINARMPDALRVDAKTQNIAKLAAGLTASDSFTCMGNFKVVGGTPLIYMRVPPL